MALAVGGLLDAASSTDAVALARTTVPYLPVGVLPMKKGTSRTSDLELWVPLHSQSTERDLVGTSLMATVMGPARDEFDTP